MKALENVMNMIFDRNACLLPAYFIVNEIQKVYPNGKNWPHWVYFIHHYITRPITKFIFVFLI